ASVPINKAQEESGQNRAENALRETEVNVTNIPATQEENSKDPEQLSANDPIENSLEVATESEPVIDVNAWCDELFGQPDNTGGYVPVH
ncbi:hypothetical protein, partial [Aeromonas veronii]|uniref:hypothetical protein n=1 Tax=Aeromonas veronii TaxID=654 RepID=UPI00406BFAF2